MKVITNKFSETAIKKHIKQLSPINEVASKHFDRLMDAITMIGVEKDEPIVRKSRQTEHLHFLLSGEVEIRESFENRRIMGAYSDQCHLALEKIALGKTTVKATDYCQLMQVDTSKLEQMLSWSQESSVHYLDDYELQVEDNALIDDEFQEGWENVFIMSNLAANLSNAAIQQLMSQLEDVEVDEGEQIIQASTPGDYFYVIKKGKASVTTEANGPYQGQQFTLGNGQYFGDEALVANTIRNADVTMQSNGLLGRLDAEAFNDLVKQHLVSALSIDELTNQKKPVTILDVRFPVEYRHGHQKGSKNIPISILRKQLEDMPKDSRYLVTPADDTRADLATYLMRQAGFDAFQPTR